MGIFATVINEQVKGVDDVIRKSHLINSSKLYDKSNDSCLCDFLSKDEDLMTMDFRVCVREYFQEQSTIDFSESSTTLLENRVYFNYSERNFVVDEPNNKVILNSPPSFLVEAGDVLVVGQRARIIQSVLSQTELVFNTVQDIEDGSGIVSQKMQTIDLTELSGLIGSSNVKINEAIPNPVLDSLVYLEDDTFDDENNVGDFFRIAFQLTGDDNVYTDSGEIPTDFLKKIAHKNPTITTGPLKLQFFAKNVSGDGVAKLKGWRAYFHKLTPEEEA